MGNIVKRNVNDKNTTLIAQKDLEMMIHLTQRRIQTNKNKEETSLLQQDLKRLRRLLKN